MAHLLEARRAEFLAHVEAGRTLSQICRLMGTKYTHTARFAALVGATVRNGASGPRKERKARADITAERVRELFLYDPQTGHLTWRINKHYNALAGQRAGMDHQSRRPSRYVRVDGIKCNEHRVIWLHVTGEWPKHFIDHLNGDASDNRWVNLRDVPHAINTQNRRTARAGARVGLLGVHVKPKCTLNPYTAVVTLNGKRKHLGMFPTAEQAHAAYVEAKRLLHVGCTL